MPRITMVRHGQAAAGFSEDLDPGLSELGRAQALAAADALAAIGPQPIISSPLRRCRETAAPLAARWGVEPVIDPAVGEIVSPHDQAGVEARGLWLRAAMQGGWSALGSEQRAWRQAVIDRVTSIEVDSVIHSHFIAINAVVGAASGVDRLVCFTPDNCSWSTFDVTRGVGGPHGGRANIEVVELGRQATTEVN